MQVNPHRIQLYSIEIDNTKFQRLCENGAMPLPADAWPTPFSPEACFFGL